MDTVTKKANQVSGSMLYLTWVATKSHKLHINSKVLLQISLNAKQLKELKTNFTQVFDKKDVPKSNILYQPL